MLDAERRPLGRVFYWAMVLIAASGVGLAGSGFGLPAYGLGVPAFGLLAAFGEQPGGLATTTVADTVYMADGSFASGNLIITWPAFVTADGSAVAPGSTSVRLGGNGGLSVALVPNAGASPAGVYYSVTYQLGPAVASREIVQPEQFKNGISQIIDGVVICMNASAWAKQKPVAEVAGER